MRRGTVRRVQRWPDASFDMGRLMSSRSAAASYYRLNATHCVEIAHDIADRERKATLVAMAQAWLMLADQAEKNSEISLVYETPTPPYPVL